MRRRCAWPVTGPYTGPFQGRHGASPRMHAAYRLPIRLLRLMLLTCADWIEHVMATDGDQYLKTPEHLLPWHVRAMLDVYLALALCFAGLVWLASLPLRWLLARRRQSGRAHPAKGESQFGVSGPRTFHVVAASQQGAIPTARLTFCAPKDREGPPWRCCRQS